MLLLTVVGVIILVVVNFFVWRGYSDKQAQAEALKIELQQVTQKVSQTTTPPSDLSVMLASANSDLEEALKVFPANVDKNDVVDFILNTAVDCRVLVLPLVLEGEDSSGVGQSKVLKYSGTVSGNLSHVTAFMTKLHNDKYPSMIITNCTVQRITSWDNTSPGEDINVSVGFHVALYISSAKGEKG